MKKVKRSKTDRLLRAAITALAITTVAATGAMIAVINEAEQALADANSTLARLQTIESENTALRQEIEATEATLNVCAPTSTFKSWMSYKAITDTTSDQWALQEQATTDENYGFRMIDGYILVAMSAEYGPVGTKYLITFDDNTTINAMIGDIKHEGCTSTPDGSMIEFIIDRAHLPNTIKRSGNFNDIFNGPITKIRLEQ